MYKSIIFLDIDGVLATAKSIKQERLILTLENGRRIAYSRLDVGCIGWLNKITNETGALFCLSSAWRAGPEDEFEMTKAYLKQEGVMAECIGRTPNAGACGSWGIRGIEIQDWLDRNPTDKFIIIDDSSDMEHLTPRLVNTDFDIGLTEVEAKLAIEMLNG